MIIYVPVLNILVQPLSSIVPGVIIVMRKINQYMASDLVEQNVKIYEQA